MTIGVIPWGMIRLPDVSTKLKSKASDQDRVPGNQAASVNVGNGQNGGGAAGSSPFTHAAPEGHAKKVSEVLGEVVWLMSQSPMHKQFFISDREWSVAEATKEWS